MERKNLEYYMKLPYTIEIIPIPESQGGGFTAHLPQIGKFAITGDGETPQEAFDSLETAKRERFIEYLEKGVEIPEPEEEKEEYSGCFIVRSPKVLHRQLVAAAKQNHTSLNQYVIFLLSTNLHLDMQQTRFDTIIEELNTMKKALWGVRYSYQVEKNIIEPYEVIDLESARLKAA